MRNKIPELEKALTGLVQRIQNATDLVVNIGNHPEIGLSRRHQMGVGDFVAMPPVGKEQRLGMVIKFLKR